MKYMLLICRDETIELGEDERRTVGPQVEAWVNEMERRGVRLQGHQLAAPQDANTVRVRQGEVVIADGPFAEAKEHIAGFDLLECADLDEAMEVASKHPVARFGAIEVRPFWED